MTQETAARRWWRCSQVAGTRMVRRSTSVRPNASVLRPPTRRHHQGKGVKKPWTIPTAHFGQATDGSFRVLRPFLVMAKRTSKEPPEGAEPRFAPLVRIHQCSRSIRWVAASSLGRMAEWGGSSCHRRSRTGAGAPTCGCAMIFRHVAAGGRKNDSGGIGGIGPGCVRADF